MKGGDKVITIRMDYGEEHKFEKIWLYPGFVQVSHGENSRLYPYQQIKHISYNEKDCQVSCGDNGGIYIRPYGKPIPVTEKSSAAQTKKTVATKKK